MCVCVLCYREEEGEQREEESVCRCVCLCEHVLGSLKMRALTEQCSCSAADVLLYFRFCTSNWQLSNFHKVHNVEYKCCISHVSSVSNSVSKHRKLPLS